MSSVKSDGKVLFLKAGQCTSNGTVYTADSLKSMAEGSSHLEFDGDSLWYVVKGKDLPKSWLKSD